MEKNQDLARVYDLIEIFNFSELSKEEKEFVLTQISEEEYMNLRSTLGDARRFFSKYPGTDPVERPAMTRKFLMLRFELYKIAAMLIVALGIGFLLSRAVTGRQAENLALADTVYIMQQDTVHHITRDTVEIIKERFILKEAYPGVGLASGREASGNPADCMEDICPDDLASLNQLSRRNNVSYDKELTEFTVALH